MGQQQAVASIRQGIQADVAQLARIERAAGRAFPPDRIPDPEATFPAEDLNQAADEGLLFVAESGGTIIGFAVASTQGDYLHLEEVSVDPDHGRGGVGRALIAEVRRETAHRRLRATTLTTFADFPWNAPFYRRIGFLDYDTETSPAHVSARLAEERALGLTHRLGMFAPAEQST